MWQLVRRLRDSGVTIILTTHYIEEAEEMADRIGVIHKGKMIVVEEKDVADAQARQAATDPRPAAAAGGAAAGAVEHPLELSDDGHTLVFTYDANRRETGIAALLRRLSELNIDVKDLHSSESSLEDIFVGLVSERA